MLIFKQYIFLFFSMYRFEIEGEFIDVIFLVSDYID
jgi:hypothetical protein